MDAGDPIISTTSKLPMAVGASPTAAPSQPSSPDARAKATEQRMTDDERFSMLVSIMGSNAVVPIRDRRIRVRFCKAGSSAADSIPTPLVARHRHSLEPVAAAE